jgi:hypothetical protein
MIKIIRSRMVRWVEQVARMENAHKMLVCKSEGMRSLVRPRHRWVNNINVKETGLRMGTSGGLLFACSLFNDACSATQTM